MATNKTKRSVHLKQAAGRSNRRATDRHLERSKPAERKNQIRSSTPTTRHPDRSGSSAERRNQIRSTPEANQLLSKDQRTQPASTNPKATTSRKLLLFPRVRGKVVKEVEFFVDPSHNCLSLRFQDNTSVNFDFATSFAMEAYFSRWKAGNERVLHYWPRIYSEPVF